MKPTYQDWIDAMTRLVRYRMKANGLSIMRLSDQTGLPVDYVKKIVDGKLFPSHKARCLLSGPLGCSLEHVSPIKKL